MANIVKNILIGCLCILVHTHAANAAECSDYNDNQSECERNNCVYNQSMSSCSGCPENRYYDTTDKDCKLCPNDFPKSPVGSVGKDSCYRFCTVQDAKDRPGPGWADSEGVTGTLESRQLYYPGTNNTCPILSCATNYVRRQAHGDEEGWTDQNSPYPYDGALYCFACPSEYPYSKPNAFGSNRERALQNCYKDCTENEPSVPNSTEVTSVSPEVYYGAICKYNVACDTSGANGCDMVGYTAVNNGTETPSCEPLVSGTNKCTSQLLLSGRYFYTYNGNTLLATQCLTPRSTCTQDTHQFVEKGTCNEPNDYGTCVLKEKQCTAVGDYLQTCCKNKSSTSCRVDGTIPYTNGYTNDENCWCVRTDDITAESGEKIGKADYYYKYTSSGTELEPYHEKKEVISCIVGYCANDDDDTCRKTPKDFYHDNDTNKECQACPSKSTTSSEGATSKDACYFTSGTVFLDDNGTFTIPNMSTVKVYWGTP